MKAPKEKVDQTVLETSVVELCLPSHLLWLMAQSVIRNGYQLRPDILSRLSAGGAAPLAVLRNNADALARCAKRVDDGARRILHTLAPDDQVHGLYCCAMFVIKLVDEGLLADPTNMAVLVAMLLVDDLKLEGGVEKYAFKEMMLKAEAGRILSAARAEMFYAVQLIAEPEKRGD